jgi:hypothetical protein
MSAYKGEWPANLNTRGQLSFPLFTDANVEEAKVWREKKGYKKTKFQEKKGATLLLKPMQFEAAHKHLLEVVLPFQNVLYKETQGDKGVEPDVVKALTKQLKDRNYLGPDGKPNLPLRELNEADKKNTGGDDSPYVGKIKFQGPIDNPLDISGLVVVPGQKDRVVSIQELIDDGVIPASRNDINKLWWGAGWNFKVSMRFSAYDSASIGISAYASKVYLLPHMGLPVSGGADAAIVEDGDDWSDDE